MGVPRKYPDELRERATRMAVEARRDPAPKAGALARTGQQLAINPETLRNWLRQAEVDEGYRPGPPPMKCSGCRSWIKKYGSSAGPTPSCARPGFLRGGARLPTQQVVAYIDAHRGGFGVEPICKVLQVALSAYYAAKTRSPSAQSISDTATTEVIQKAHADNYGVYGVSKMLPSCADKVTEWSGARCTG